MVTVTDHRKAPQRRQEMDKKEQVETENMIDSLFKHVLANFLVIIFMVMLLWMAMA